MKSIAVGLLVGTFLLWSPAPARADEASKNAKIEEMLQLTHVDRMMTQMLDQMKTMAAAQMGKTDLSAADKQRADEMQQKMIALIADRMSWEKAKPAYIKVYADTFTEGEIDGILAFYKSPAGKAMLDKTPQLMQKSMEISQQMMGDLMPQIQKMIQDMKQDSDKK